MDNNTAIRTYSKRDMLQSEQSGLRGLMGESWIRNGNDGYREMA